ncbi:MAG: DUF2071 domain-containing protein [Cyclobacteriaceae bacterium]|nr:DUF2071 domain-containing protein [Cyclobacteriaceae bacterium]
MKKLPVNDLLQLTNHRPWPLPATPWQYYQEWNDAVFLHWQVEPLLLKPYMPDGLELDQLEGTAWISLVAFTMQYVRPRGIPAFSPVSDFHEINIRTYVVRNGKQGVYFLSIEAARYISSFLAKTISGLPYVTSTINRSAQTISAQNTRLGTKFDINYEVHENLSVKTEADRWLTERYALFQNHGPHIISYDIHHLEWPVNRLSLTKHRIDYPALGHLLNAPPVKTHYSPGVQVIAWGKQRMKPTP